MRESVKHRLIGGAVLAAIAVLFLPSFFKDRQQYQVDTSSHIPGRPSITAVDFNEPTRPEGIEPAPAPENMFVPDESESVTTTQIPPAEDTVVGSAEASSKGTVNAYFKAVASTRGSFLMISMSTTGLRLRNR